MDSKLIMVRGRTSDRVGDALSRMLEGTKPRQAEHTATAGELDAEPAPHLSPEPPALLPNPNGGSPAGADHTHQSAPALFLNYEQIEICLAYAIKELSEFEAIRALTHEGLNVCEAMTAIGSWE